MARALIARPRLDCSFKKGAVPATEGPPLNNVLALFGTFLDNLETHFQSQGWEVVNDKRPLWQFELDEIQRSARTFDLVLFPHKLAKQFPIGPNALYYKTTPIPEFLTVDHQGWGASLSFLPAKPEASPQAEAFYDELQQRVTTNQSVFAQPAQAALPDSDYLLFVCQVPHDETIIFHSDVKVEEALAAVIAYANAKGEKLIVKGHPANRKAMAQFKAMTEESKTGIWVDDVSIHSCLAGARRVFMVNSGVGIEAMLHGKTVTHFGRAEYSNIYPKARPTCEAIAALDDTWVSRDVMAAFLYSFFSKTIRYDDMATYSRVLARYMSGSDLKGKSMLVGRAAQIWRYLWRGR